MTAFFPLLGKQETKRISFAGKAGNKMHLCLLKSRLFFEEQDMGTWEERELGDRKKGEGKPNLSLQR